MTDGMVEGQMTQRQDMAAVFGLTLMPPMTRVEGATVAVISFETDPAALALRIPAICCRPNRRW